MPRRNGRMRNKAPAPHRKRQARWPSESPTRFGNPTGWILRNFPRRHVDGAGWGCTTAGAAEDQRRSGEIRRRGLVYSKHQFFAQPDPQQEQFPTPWFLRWSSAAPTVADNRARLGDRYSITPDMVLSAATGSGEPALAAGTRKDRRFAADPNQRWRWGCIDSGVRNVRLHGRRYAIAGKSGKHWSYGRQCACNRAEISGRNRRASVL